MTAYEMRISDWSSDLCSSDLLLTHDKDTVVGAHFLGHRVPQRFANGLALELCTFRQPRIGDFGSNRGTFRSLGRLNFSAFRWRFFASGCDASRTLAFLAGDRGNDGANLYISSAFRDQNFRDNPFIRSEEHTSELQSLMR